jgi:hypothetical protein
LAARLDETSELYFKFNFVYLPKSAKSESEAHRWKILRSYDEIRTFHGKLERAMRAIEVPVPEFPSSRNFRSLPNETKLDTLTDYIGALCKKTIIVTSPVFLAFAEVSVLSFDRGSRKRKEGFLRKRTGGRVGNEKRCFNCAKYFKRFQTRWFVVRDNMVGYLTDNTKAILHESLMFKGNFKVFSGPETTGYKDGIRIMTNQRDLIVRAGSEVKRDEWAHAIQKAYNNSEWNRL